MDLRPATDLDMAAAPEWLEGIDLRADRWRDDCTRAVVGVENGAIVAAGRIFTGIVHDSRYWTEVMVAPGSRRRGYGRAVATRLSDLRADPRPLCSRGFASSPAAGFARSVGARPYQTCPPERVRTGDVERLQPSSVSTQRAADECRERSQVDGLLLLRACVRDSLLSLEEDDIAAVSFDGHDTDPHFRPLLDELPVSGEAFVLLE